MNTRMAKPLVLTIAAALVGACATTGEQTSGSTADQQRTRAEGAAAGAVLGGLLGYVLGGDDKKRNVAIGAVLGGVAGYAIGNEVARRKAQYASEEAFLDAEIREATEFNRTAAQYNQKLRTEIAALDQTSMDLEQRYRAGVASKQQLAAQSAEVKRKLAETQNVYDTLKKEYDLKVAVYQEQQQTRRPGDAYLALLQREIRQLENNLDQLRSESIQLAQIDERLAR